jgi:hypothetical protein
MKTRVLFSSIWDRSASYTSSLQNSLRCAYLLHGGLGVERVDENLLSVHAGGMGDRLARVLAGAGQLEGLRAAHVLAGKNLL